MSDIIPFDSLDQSLPVDVTPELDYVDEVFQKTLLQNEPEVMFGYMVGIQQQFQIRGLALCKSLHLMNEYWDSFELGDNFIDTAQHYLGLARHTIERYIKVWDMFSTAPALLVPELQQKNLKSLFPIANAIAQGYEIEDATWDKLADAPDYSSVSKIINEEVKEGEGERSNKMSLSMTREGSLYVYVQDVGYFFGSFEINDDNQYVQKAIERMIKNGGVLKP